MKDIVFCAVRKSDIVFTSAFASSAHALVGGARLAASEAYRRIRFNRGKEKVDDMAMPFVGVVIDFHRIANGGCQTYRSRT
ncbi:hypothetical protein [Rhizobium leguminosarum]|uniref:hypothetical protein n=1 Tax=Rhizobium leguminosarum TaxID=384 RepID=UPI001FD9B092|nr:hypothetical protein [Rhizobium leguminosarum]